MYHQAEIASTLSIYEAARTLAQNGIRTQIRYLPGESLVTRARNRLVAEFMADTNFTHLQFVDCDLAFDADAILKMVTHDVDLVGGAYPKKGDPAKPDFVVNFIPGSADRLEVRKGLIKVVEVPTGFMCIKRTALQRLMDAHPEWHCRMSSKITAEQLPYSYALFDCGIRSYEPGGEKWYLSEDWEFCRRMADIGIDIWLDPSIEFTHIGTYGFKGRLLDYATPLD